MFAAKEVTKPKILRNSKTASNRGRAEEGSNAVYATQPQGVQGLSKAALTGLCAINVSRGRSSGRAAAFLVQGDSA